MVSVIPTGPKTNNAGPLQEPTLLSSHTCFPRKHAPKPKSISRLNAFTWHTILIYPRNAIDPSHLAPVHNASRTQQRSRGIGIAKFMENRRTQSWREIPLRGTDSQIWNDLAKPWNSRRSLVLHIFRGDVSILYQLYVPSSYYRRLYLFTPANSEE